ncbi:MAG TPA: phosphoenolpyruvate--protein phosphotransferase [Haloferula sp.]
MNDPPNVVLKGRGTSPGFGRGITFLHRNLLDRLSPPRLIAQHEVEGEQANIERAVEAVLADLKLSALRIEAQTGPKLAAIFGAHEVVLQDASLKMEIFRQIEQNLIGAAQALAEVFQGWQNRFRAKPEDSMKERADDLEDLQGRLLREIAGVKTTPLESMPPGRVLVAHRLLPSETVALPQLKVAGIILEFGGIGSHAALLARALGIPTVAQIPNALAMIREGEDVIVDGFKGEIILRPDAPRVADFETRASAARKQGEVARRAAHKPAVTKAGVEVSVAANVGSREDVNTAIREGADGVGLFRTEQLYLGRTTPPSARELLDELRSMFRPMAGKPITIRLLDLGADKPVSFLNFPAEDDPFLGCRGVRLLLRYPDLLETQLTAILEFSREFPLRIMVPMITTEQDIQLVRDRALSIAASLGIKELPPLGAMIETPASALTVPNIMRHADFLSIGTNDLTQYTMAAGRENPLVHDYYREDHPAVLRLMRMVFSEVGTAPVSICGELAGDPSMTATLIEMGARQLSVAPPLIPLIKDAIRLAGSDREIQLHLARCTSKLKLP